MINKKVVTFLVIVFCLFSPVNISNATDILNVALNNIEAVNVDKNKNEESTSQNISEKEKMTLDDLSTVYNIMQKDFDAEVIMDDVIKETKNQISNISIDQSLIDKILEAIKEFFGTIFDSVVEYIKNSF